MADDGVNPEVGRRIRAGCAELERRARAGCVEVTHRTAAVRAAKIEKARRGLGTDLNPDELDAIFPPIDCYRTRARLARGTALDPRERSPNDA